MRRLLFILSMVGCQTLLGGQVQNVLHDYVAGYSEGDLYRLAGCFSGTSTHNGRRTEKDMFEYFQEFKRGSRRMVLSDVVISADGRVTAWVDIESQRGRCSGPVDFEFNRDGYIQNMWSACQKDGEGASIDMAMLGQGADVATTVIGMSAGMAEANPLVAGAGLPLASAVKLGLSKYAETLPATECRTMRGAATFSGWGATGWNLCVLATAGSGGAAAIPCAAIGLISGYAMADAYDESNVRICRSKRPGTVIARIDADGVHSQ